ncbi:MAG: ribonuclease HIII [Bacilli bacterium]|nr:ribonuclease HIII [Bacilli bacterium]MBO6285435.1 ribonuclease HIII [Bacilli bacterium]
MDKPTSVTLMLTEESLTRMADFYGEQLVEPSSPYIAFAAKADGVTITAYKKETKGLHKVLFQGPSASYEAKVWDKLDKTPTRQDGLLEKAEEEFLRQPKTLLKWRDQIGSDEVGTGDFFGPIIVVAAYVSMGDTPLLKNLGVTDSKMLSDDKILDIVPQIIKTVDYSQLYLPNDKYNQVIRQGNNMNSIKAKMHNRCLLNLKARHPEAIVYQDQFAEPSLYFSYLKNEKEVLREIHFETKGESKFLSVATASVIARYSFLRHMELLGEQYRTHFPLGAGNLVDEFAREFVDEHGMDELNNVAKTNFANMRKL